MIGGTYMTVSIQPILLSGSCSLRGMGTQLLNTISNMGGTWPRYFVLRGLY